jgi:hypothetical protein
MPERIIALSQQVSSVATRRVDDIRQVTRMTKILALNAAIEAARAGQAGAGFAIVSSEVGNVSEKIETLAEHLSGELASKTAQLNEVGHKMVAEIRGSRLADLALNMIDVIDRNLYERSCDVRWWATDAAVVDCASRPDDSSSAAHASERLSVILDSYTVYLDLWITDQRGRVIANGRSDKYPSARGANVGDESWFRKALETNDGTEFVATDISPVNQLGGAKVPIYSTAIREGGRSSGKPVGVLGIFFDWEKQSQAVVDSVRLSDDERPRTRCLILDSAHRVIAASDGTELFQRCSIKTDGHKMSTYVDKGGTLVGFALGPGYETYTGLGWYGVLLQQPHTKTEAQ